MIRILLLLALGGCAATAQNTCVARCTECKGSELICNFERGGQTQQIPTPQPR